MVWDRKSGSSSFVSLHPSAFLRKLSQHSQDWKSTGDGTNVGLFLPLPASLDVLLPLRKKDTSPAHASFLIIGEVPEERREEVLSLVRRELGRVKGPLRVTATRVGHFENDKGESIAHLIPEFSTDLLGARRGIVAGLRSLGIEPKDKGADEWKPHITLDYLPKGETWEGSLPPLEWTSAEMEVWGLPEHVSVPFDFGEHMDRKKEAQSRFWARELVKLLSYR